jgi:hypothetical protein
LGDRSRAEELLRAAVEAAAVAGPSFVRIWSLEAPAAVVSAQDRSRLAAVVLGGPVEPPDDALRAALATKLGAAEFGSALRDGERLTPTEALALIE